MTARETSPRRFANEISALLNQVFPGDRFPVAVDDLAKEYSQHRYPNDPISLVKGASLPGFEGALYRAPKGKTGWGIIYNTNILSPGRIRFTQAHEFGHYLLHRVKHPDGIECSSQDMVRWDSDYGQLEHEANLFASTLLMPLDDFRRQIDASEKPTIEQIDACAHRYGVSFTAATLRWLEYTERRALLVVSREGFIMWGRSSQRAYKSGAYFKTSGKSPIAVPGQSLAALGTSNSNEISNAAHGTGVWFEEPCEEAVVTSDKFDFVASILFLENAPPRTHYDEEDLEDSISN